MREPDIEIGAVVKARKLRFKTVPETEVRTGGRHAEGGSHTERENLPEQVEPGVTYRDVTVRWRAAARLDEVADDADKEARS
jgi:hypothetical protein